MCYIPGIMEALFPKALGAGQGIVCAVGAGGKKSLLYAIARAHPGRVAITATVPVAPFPRDIPDEVVIAEPETLDTRVAQAARTKRIVAYAAPSNKPGRLGGVAPEAIHQLHRQCSFDLTLVKADGARMRGIKAPREGEPNLPRGADTVLFVLSIQVVGRMLDERCAHRIERLSAVTGAEPGEPLGTQHLARLLSSPEGALKNADSATVIPVINQVDEERWWKLARDVARRTLALTDRFDRVALTALNREQAVMEIINRRVRSRSSRAGI